MKDCVIAKMHRQQIPLNAGAHMKGTVPMTATGESLTSSIIGH